MQLTLVPPDAYPIPPAFHAHELKPPSFRPRKSVKSPELWTRTRQQLAEVGIRVPDPLAGDLAAWWSYAVSAVEWNLELEEVIVTLADGTRERWDLQPSDRVRSTSVIEDSEMEDVDGPTEPMMASSSPLESDPTADRPSSSRWHADAVSARLRSFALQLRSAYEDLGTATVSDPVAPDISTETDYRLLMLLAAEPSRQIPFEWSDAQIMYEYAMMGVDGNTEEGPEAETTREGRMPAWRRELRRPSQGRRRDADDPDDFDPAKFTGQFRSKRRPAGRKDSNGRPIEAYTYLAVIDLLTQIRSYLCDLFAATVIPQLRDRLPPSYTLWATDSAIVWVRREAIKRARDAADLIVELLDDDGDRFDSSECSSSCRSSPMQIDADDRSHPFDIIVDMDEAEGMLDGSQGMDEWQAEEHRQQRLADNPLRLLRDDYELRKWCIDMSDRARMLDLVEDDTTAIRSPDWIKRVPSFEVSSLDGAQSSDSDMPGIGRSVRRKTLFSSRSRIVETPSSSPPPGVNRDRSASPDVPGLTHSDTETEPSSEVDELSEEDIAVGSTLLARDFFYPDDPLGEGFLPRRLPLELVDKKSKGGAELQEHRELLHSVLNEVAGLQKRLVALHELVKEETKTWEEERAQSVASPDSKASLVRVKMGRTISHPPPGPVRRRHPPRPGAPLLKQSCDRALGQALDEAYRQSDSPSMPKHVRQGKLTAAAQELPRKRQRHNLETYGRLMAMSNHILRDEPEVPIPAFMQQRKRVSNGPGFRRKRKNGGAAEGSIRPAKRVKRHRQQDNSGTEADEQTPSAASARPRVSPSPDQRHLAAAGLSARRRRVLEALSNDSGLGSMPFDSAFGAGDEGDDDDDESGTDSLDAPPPAYDSALDWGDELDELEEVVVGPVTQQEELPVEEDQTRPRQQRASDSIRRSGEPLDGFDYFEAPTRFGSPIPYSRPHISPLVEPAALPIDSAGSATHSLLAAQPAYPLSAARLESDATPSTIGAESTPAVQLGSLKSTIRNAAQAAEGEAANSPQPFESTPSLFVNLPSDVTAQLEAQCDQRSEADGHPSGLSDEGA
ncbi:hypothetical protein BMF94_2148 [Rhodotorula taiwanensis]|uniref:Uncharacterized protein n=1 Tax=Rhodotorula taiwanensis TaxID=741276 RepID=A0A2S5BDL8_9BASI|nr:hypothetical protein BMF94_2148 [Rhodotorula taiwanensis]